MTHAIGVDFGATGIKAALVDCASGELLSDRLRVDTPSPATPAAVRDAISGLVARFEPAPVGVAVPAVVQHGVVRSAANIDDSWIGTSLPALLDAAIGVPTAYLNDADAAGLAEASFGSARDHRGLVVVVTIGTGIGTALLYDGRLVPNAELGHLELDGVEAELIGSGRALERSGCAWDAWTGVVSRYLQHLEALLWPDLIVIGGGVASTPEHWFPHLRARTPLRLATHGKSAGLVGAAHAVATLTTHPSGVTP
ncbi:MAG TPA: ROK family protein [Nocardioides sp.]|nr:ROK family protein [Nocardioides sp.]